MKTIPELSKILEVGEELLRYHLLNDRTAPAHKIKRGKTGGDTKCYDENLVINWWKEKMEQKAKRAPHRRNARPIHTANEIAEWIALQRKNKWSINQLAKYLGKGFKTVQDYIDKYDAGLLK